ncbi:hypothetical protein [Meiothermus sp.]|uniref:hypothetical protein n=1 Tax=Meiothermus sp. TaxID=1955249 RepID=UPI00307DB458
MLASLGILPEATRQELRRLLPQLPAPNPEPDPNPEVARVRLLNALLEGARLLAGDRALVLEDLHWADEATLGFVVEWAARWAESNGAYAYQGSAERPWQTAYRTSGGSFTLNPADSAPGGSMGILPGSYSANQHQGRWRVVLFGTEWLLVLRAQDGQLYTRVLSNLDKRFPFFDGKEVASFGASNRCR